MKIIFRIRFLLKAQNENSSVSFGGGGKLRTYVAFSLSKQDDKP